MDLRRLTRDQRVAAERLTSSMVNVWSTRGLPAAQHATQVAQRASRDKADASQITPMCNLSLTSAFLCGRKSCFQTTRSRLGGSRSLCRVCAIRGCPRPDALADTLSPSLGGQGLACLETTGLVYTPSSVLQRKVPLGWSLTPFFSTPPVHTPQ